MYNIRLASIQDTSQIAAFNSAMAFETEEKRLIPDVIEAGVRNLISQPERGFYWLMLAPVI